MDTPNPGSDEAIKQGCICPVIDNAHGKGYMGKEGVFVFTGDCPLHDPEGRTAKVLDELQRQGTDRERQMQELLKAALAALERLRARENECPKLWARRLGQDLSKFTD